MRLVLENRSNQHAQLSITPPLRDEKPMCAAVISVDAGATASVDGSAIEITAIVDDLVRFGVTERNAVARLDAARHRFAGPWQGITFEITSDG